MEAEGRRGDEPERAERAAGDLGQIEAGDVLHHLAAALGDGAVGADDRDADDQVAHGSIAGAARAEVPGRDDAYAPGPLRRGPGGGGADRARASGPRRAPSLAASRS